MPLERRMRQLQSPRNEEVRGLIVDECWFLEEQLLGEMRNLAAGILFLLVFLGVIRILMRRVGTEYSNDE